MLDKFYGKGAYKFILTFKYRQKNWK